MHAGTHFKKSRLLWPLLLIVVFGVLAGAWSLRGHFQSRPVALAPEYPEYLSFVGNYVFTVPQKYAVDEQTSPGMQLLYSGPLPGNNLNGVYAANAISVQPLAFLSGH